MNIEEKQIVLCLSCKKAITDKDETERIASGLVHRDCYLKELGEQIEKHPISQPEVRVIDKIRAMNCGKTIPTGAELAAMFKKKE